MSTCSICKHLMEETTAIMYVRDPDTNVMRECIMCNSCAGEVAGYMVRLMEQLRQPAPKSDITERLERLKAGAIVTIFDNTPRAMPSADLRKALEGTNYAKIWEV